MIENKTQFFGDHRQAKSGKIFLQDPSFGISQNNELFSSKAL
jgi:hypothetical protein